MNPFTTWLIEAGFIAEPAEEALLNSRVITRLRRHFEAESHPGDHELAAARIVGEYIQSHPQHRERFEQIEAEAVQAGWEPRETELRCLRASRPTAPSNIIGGGSGRPSGAATLEASLCLSAGVPEEFIGREYGEAVANEALSARHRGATLHSVLHAVIRAAGQHADPGKVTDNTIRAAFEASSSLRASGGFSTLSLPGILANVQNKAVLASYNAVRTTWPLWVRADSIKDFKPSRRFRLIGQGEFAEVPPDGELKHVSLAEQDYTSQLSTHGAILSITRQMLIDDDMSALAAVPARLGRMGAIKIEKSIYQLLLSNPGDFFDVATNQISDPLDIDGLAAAETKFLNAVDDNGDPVLIEPTVLLVPTSLATDARKLVRDTSIVLAGAGGAEDNEFLSMTSGNPFAGRFTAAATPWLNSQNLTGSSSTAWYLLTGPTDAAVASIAFLNGRSAPVVETGESSFETLGIKTRAYHDFGVAMHDPRGGVKSTGAG